MKKPKKVDAPAPDGVDMERIYDLMGPLPNEKNNDSKKEATENIPKLPEKVEKSLPPTAPPVTRSTAIAEAALEANETLKAMADKLQPGSEVKPDERLLDEPSTEETTTWLDSIAEPEAGAALVVGEGLAGDDPKVVDAVDDIVANESDTVLQAEDTARNAMAPAPKNLGTWLKAVWAKPTARWGILAFILLLLLAIAVIPTSRYFVLNTAGARSSMGISIIDSSTLQPLKNVTVAVGGVNVETDSKGIAKLEHIKLGDQTLKISKRAFMTISKQLVVGWGSNPQGSQRLVASGTQYTFVVTDFLSGKPLEKAEATSGEGDAVSDKSGKIVLTLDTSTLADADLISVGITAANYRAETVKIAASNKETNGLKLVSDRKDVFVSKRSGKYDLYTIDVDGKNEKKLVEGTGLERPNQELVIQQNGEMAAYVATRENARNSDGYLLSTLYLVDTQTGVLSKIDQSEQIQIIGWTSDGRVVYVKIAAGASGSNPKRYRLMSVNTKNVTENKEIASANAFNDVMMAGDKVLYAPSNALADNPNPGLFIVDADGTGAVTITSKETFNIFRTDYSNVIINASGEYYAYKIGAAPNTLIATKAPSNVNRLYIDGYKNGKSLWVDSRDGKTVVQSFDMSTQKDTALATLDGAKIPAYWLNDSNAIFRVNDGKQTADYVVSINGGEAKKIADVSDVAGIGRWYYY